MRIAVLTPVFTPYRGGIGVVAHANAKMARELGHQVTVLTPWYPYMRKKGIPAKETIDGFTVMRLRPFISFGNAAILPQLYFLLKNFDRIHFHYPFIDAALPLLFARIFFKKQFIITYHMDLVGKDGLSKGIFSAYTTIILPLIMKYVRTVLVSSMDYTRASRLAPYITTHRSHLTVIPHSVDTEVFQKKDVTELRTKHKLEESQQVVLFVGGLDSAHYFKGVEFLLEAFAEVLRTMEEHQEHPLPVLILVGYGNMIPYYENISGQLGIREKVIFAGSAESASVLASYYSAATVTVLPSVDQSESFGIVLIESLSCGTPVIASDLPGIRSVVRDTENGFLVQSRNVDALAEKLHDLIKDPQKARALGEEGRRIVEEEYSYTHVKELFRTVLQ